MSERRAGAAHDDANRLLPELLLVGGRDGVDALLHRRIFRNDDHHDLAALAQDGAALPAAPLTRRIDYGETIGKARRDLARQKLRPGLLADAEPAGAAAKQQVNRQHALLRGGAIDGLGRRSVNKKTETEHKSVSS